MTSAVYSRILFIVIFLSGTTAMPAPGGHHDGSIPWQLIIAQTFNFTLFVVIMGIIIKKFLVPVFPAYRSKFIEDSTKAQRDVAEAEKKRKEIEEMLGKLETTYSSRLEKAKKESVDFKNKLISEANNNSEKLIKNTTENILASFKSIERQFKMMILDKAIQQAKDELPKEINEKELQRLHSEFIEEIRVNS